MNALGWVRPQAPDLSLSSPLERQVKDPQARVESCAHQEGQGPLNISHQDSSVTDQVLHSSELLVLPLYSLYEALTCRTSAP